MVQFKSKDSFEIIGRGKVFVVENNRERYSDDWHDLTGQKVQIDDTVFECRGVEFNGHRISAGAPIGILVKDS